MQHHDPGSYAHPTTRQLQEAAAQGEGRTLFVVVGASAGGIPALESLLGALGDGEGLVVVVAQHMPREHQSDLAGVLGRRAQFPVHWLDSTVEPQAGAAYVLAPALEARMQDGVLQVVESAPESHHPPIDPLLRSLAAEHGSDVVAVVLSGTGQHGLLGAQKVHEQGGLVFVQALTEAEFPQMPEAIIRAGLADRVAPAAELGRAVQDLRRVAAVPGAQGPSADGYDPDLVRQILSRVRAVTGHDFGGYKRPTIHRRLERRMQVHGLADLGQYYERVQGDSQEAEALERDLLISVTSFFRDPEAFELVQREVLRPLLADKGETDQVRIWVPGCATGEEAYTVAILVAEVQDELPTPPLVQIFATDRSATSLHLGREGLYPAAVRDDVSSERLERFFVPEEENYRVSKRLRRMVLFAAHDLIKDPPFSKLDLISCRNLLIYLDRPLQEHVLRLFHYALQPGGYLFLGPSETPDGASHMFSEVDRKMRLYARQQVPAELPELALPGQRHTEAPLDHQLQRDNRGRSRTHDEMHADLRAAAAPPTVLVGRNREVLNISKGAGEYLGFRSHGEFTQDVTRLVASELQLEMRTGLHQALHRNVEVVGRPVTVSVSGTSRRVRLLFRPVHASASPREGERANYVLIIFEALPRPTEASTPSEMTDHAVVELERQVNHLREQLHLVVEEYETQQVEYKAAIEELQSMNEEVRSTAEELETSREEAQSTSEELQTVNDELQVKVRELSEAYSHVENLLSTSGIATLVLDREMQIRSASALMAELAGIDHRDVGRKAVDRLGAAWPVDQLLDAARRVLRTLIPDELEFKVSKGDFLVRMRPYRSAEDQIDGVVIVFIDATETRHLQSDLAAAVATLEGALVALPTPVLITTPALEVILANPAAEELLGANLADVSLFELLADSPDLRELRRNFTDLRPGQAPARATIRRRAEGAERFLLMEGRALKDVDRFLFVLSGSDEPNPAPAAAADERARPE